MTASWSDSAAGAEEPVADGLDMVLDALAHTYDAVMMLHPSGASLPAFAERTPDAALLLVSAAQGEETAGAMRDRILALGVEAVTVVSLTATEPAGESPPPTVEEERRMAGLAA